MSLLGIGLNSTNTYGKKEDKLTWWPKKNKWKEFRTPSQASKEECTKLIKHLLSHYQINPETHYVHFPKEEDVESSESSSDEDDDARKSSDEDDDSSGDINVGDKEEIDLGNEDVENDNRPDGIEEMQNEYARYQAEELVAVPKPSKKQKRQNYVELNNQKKRNK